MNSPLLIILGDACWGIRAALSNRLRQKPEWTLFLEVSVSRGDSSLSSVLFELCSNFPGWATGHKQIRCVVETWEDGRLLMYGVIRNMKRAEHIPNEGLQVCQKISFWRYLKWIQTISAISPPKIHWQEGTKLTILIFVCIDIEDCPHCADVLCCCLLSYMFVDVWLMQLLPVVH